MPSQTPSAISFPTERQPVPAPIRTHYDAVIIGARVAGAATAMLLARRGLDVLVIDRAAPGTDTLSSHALMRGAVAQLDRWGLLRDVIDAGTPVIRHTTFRYGGEEVVVDIRPEGGAEGLIAPRRTVLDPIIVRAAIAAGAEVCHHTSFVDVRRSAGGRVDGVVIDTAQGLRTISTDLVIGADGLRSKVARRLGAPVTHRGASCMSSTMTYVDNVDLPDDRYQWLNQPDVLGGVIPTNDGAYCVFVSVPSERFRHERHDVEGAYRRGLRHLAPDIAAAVEGGNRIGPLRSWPGHVGQFRQANGPGWALVGDAGYFKDPGAAHGISDALRDAELLANAVIDGNLSVYGNTRDALSAGLFESLEKIVDMTWTFDQLPERHLRMSKAMSVEHRAAQELFERYSATASGLIQPLGM